MNAGAGLIQGPFRNRVERLEQSYPSLTWQELHRRARSMGPDEPLPPVVIKPPSQATITPMEFDF
jgi:hypothetical protein